MPEGLSEARCARRERPKAQSLDLCSDWVAIGGLAAALVQALAVSRSAASRAAAPGSYPVSLPVSPARSIVQS